MVAVDVKHHVYLLTATMKTVFHKQHTALWTDQHYDDSISQTAHRPLNWPALWWQYFTNNTQPSEMTTTMLTVFHKQLTHSPLNWTRLWWQYFTSNTVLWTDHDYEGIDAQFRERPNDFQNPCSLVEVEVWGQARGVCNTTLMRSSSTILCCCIVSTDG